ncbi:uncharacterized protein LOC119928472 isoform X4 [Tachyglossus aculeatus]|uniref:uncharacterized protein LOC119928472 isoform X4 n=1 Tax=Tachyglossus aculeatus TaxID=9261 RepID=UPI0018F5C26A|nr:uncharacterized protein LOC119928472 isoform X4 [Tachyglossus aculeatus]
MKVFGLLLLLAGMVDGAAISPAQDLGRERRSYFDDSVDSDYVFRNGWYLRPYRFFPGSGLLVATAVQPARFKFKPRVRGIYDCQFCLGVGCLMELDASDSDEDLDPHDPHGVFVNPIYKPKIPDSNALDSDETIEDIDPDDPHGVFIKPNYPYRPGVIKVVNTNYRSGTWDSDKESDTWDSPEGICRCCPGLGGLLLVLKLTNQDFKLACVNDRPPQLGTSVSPHCKILPLLFFLPNFHLAFQVLFS